MKKLALLLLLTGSLCFAQAEKKSNVKFSAKIENRNSDTLKIYGPNRFVEVIPMKNGEFASSFETMEGIHQFSDGTESSLFYLKDGDNIALKMNAKEFDETIVYSGKGAEESNFLAKKALTDEQFQNDLESLLDQDETVFKAKLKDKLAADTKSLETAKLSENFKTIVKQMIANEERGLNNLYNRKSAEKKLVGTISTSFDFENHKGGKTKLEDLRGKYVYIDVWATWCGPCRAEIPYLQKQEEKYHGKNIEFVSISVDTDRDHEKWNKFVTDKALGGIQLFADKNWDSDFIKAYNINSIPRFILIDPNGKIVSADAPRPSSQELTNMFDKLLK